VKKIKSPTTGLNRTKTFSDWTWSDISFISRSQIRIQGYDSMHSWTLKAGIGRLGDTGHNDFKIEVLSSDLLEENEEESHDPG
jgi:hypothetical protein